MKICQNVLSANFSNDGEKLTQFRLVVELVYL